MGMLVGTAEQVLPGGEAVVRYEQGVALVVGAFPGERVAFMPLKRRRGALRGRLMNVLSASPDRTRPLCPHADRCGGCQLQGLKVEAQMRLKSEWVRRVFQPFMSSESCFWPVSERPSLHRRRRARWHVGVKGTRRYLGFRERGSHRVVEQSHCPLVHPTMDALIRSIEGDIPEGVQSVQLTRLSDGIHGLFKGGKPMQDLPQEGVCWWHVTGEACRPIGKGRLLHDCIHAQGVTCKLEVGPLDFVQADAEGNQAMINQLFAWAAQANFVVDLFCGIGNLSLPLALHLGCRVVGADVNPASIQRANANARRLGVQAHYKQADLFRRVDGERFAGADLLILDPPRSGARLVCSSLARLLPKQIVLISCDLGAAGRDASLIASLGYRLRACRAFDLFPFTGHVEAMSLWTR